MNDRSWSGREKQIARDAYEQGRQAALVKVVSDFRKDAAAVESVDDVWAIGVRLRETRKDLDQMLDYRYSQLIFVFAQLIQAGYLREEQLAGLAEDKLESIRFLLSRRAE